MTCSRIRAARVDDADALAQIAVGSTRQDGYDDEAISRFMPGLKVNLALIAAGLVLVAEDEHGAPLGYVTLRSTGMAAWFCSKAFSSIQFIRAAMSAGDCLRPQSSIREGWPET